MRRRFVTSSRLFASAALAGLLMLWATPAAFGHAAFLGSTPAPGARLHASPRQVGLSFTEPLIRRLTKVTLVRVADGRTLDAQSAQPSQRRLVLRPSRALSRGAYRIRWHSVSTQDGHALEGSFSFGVRAAAAGGGQALQESPLARGGALRVAARLVLYVALLLFAGALLLRAVLCPRGGTWLVPDALGAVAGVDLAALRARERSITSDLGIFAAGGAAAAALLEASDAAQGLSPSGLREFLLTNLAGIGRVGVVVLVAVALVLWQRRPRAAAALAALALLAVAASGHASSASPRVPAIVNDWVHLLAGAAWLGGIGLIALVWGRRCAQRRARCGSRSLAGCCRGSAASRHRRSSR